MYKRALFICFLLAFICPAFAQYTCPTAPTGANDTRCASTAFVNNAGGSTSIFVTDSTYGAKCNVAWQTFDGSILSSSNQFTSNNITFTTADIGKSIVINRAGAAGVPLATTITAVNGHVATLATTASNTVPDSGIGGAFVATSQSGAGNYAPNDTITLAGGTFSHAAVVTVLTTQVVTATVAAGGSGGTTGTQTVTGTTGVGVLFQASVTISGGAITAVNSISFTGRYTTNPTTLATEPVIGAGLSGAQLSVTMGVATVNVTTVGDYSVVPSTTLSQGSTSGSGTGATFSIQNTNLPYWYYGTDDSIAINAALTAATQVKNNGYPVSVVIPAGGCLTTKTITIPSVGAFGFNNAISPQIVGQGMLASTIWAGASGLTSVINIPTTNFTWGGGLQNLSVEAFKLATYGVYDQQGQFQNFYRVSVQDALTSEWQVSDASHNVYNAAFDHIEGFTNAFNFQPSLMSFNNFASSGNLYDSEVSYSYFTNASGANVYEPPTGDGLLKLIGNNAFGYPYPEYYPSYNFETGNGTYLYANETGGSSVADFLINGNNNEVIGNNCLFPNFTQGTAACVQIAAGATPALITGTIMGVGAVFASYLPTSQIIVQLGKAGNGTIVVNNPQATYSAGITPLVGSWLINGDFLFDQPHEFNSVTPANFGLVTDRWRHAGTQANKLSYQGFTNAAPTGGGEKITVAATASVGSTDNFYMYQQIIGSSIEGMSWGTSSALPATLSFCLTATVTGQYSVSIGNAFAATLSYVFPVTVSTASTRQCFATTIPGPTTGTWTASDSGVVVVRLSAGTGSTFQTNNFNSWIAGNYFGTASDITLVTHAAATLQVDSFHLNPGSNATSYIVPAYETELNRALRFYKKSFPKGTVPAQNAGVAGATCVQNPIANGQPSTYIQLSPPFQSSPTVTTFNPSASNANWRDVTASADTTVSVDPSTAISNSGFEIATGATVAVLADSLCIQWTADSAN